jgi:hypothetical protein
MRLQPHEVHSAEAQMCTADACALASHRQMLTEKTHQEESVLTDDQLLQSSLPLLDTPVVRHMRQRSLAPFACDAGSGPFLKASSIQ